MVTFNFFSKYCLFFFFEKHVLFKSEIWCHKEVFKCIGAGFNLEYTSTYLIAKDVFLHFHVYTVLYTP